MDSTNETKYKCMVASRMFWDEWLAKFFSLWVSVKFLGLFFVTLISTVLLVKGYIEGSDWKAVIIGVYGIIYAVREAFKTNGVGALIKDIIKKKIREAKNKVPM